MGNELVATMDEINFVGESNNSYNRYPKNYNQGQGFRHNQNQGMYRPPPMHNKRHRQEERHSTLQEIVLQYVAQNDKRMK